MHHNNKAFMYSTMTTMSLSRNSSSSSSSSSSPHHHNRRASAAAAAAAVAGRMGSWLLCFVAGCCLGHFHGRFFSSSSSGSGTAAFVYSPPTTTILTTTSMGTERRTSLATTNLSPHPKEGGDCLQNDGDGWHTIHVFYGKADDHLDENDAADAAYSYSYTEEEPSYIGSANDASVIVGATTTPASLLDDAQQQQQQEQQRQLRRQPLLEGEQQQQPRRRRRRQRWYSQARQDELVIALLRNKTDGYFVDLAANDAIQLSNTYALERYYHWRGVCIEPNPVYWHNLTTFRTCTTVAAVVGAERMQEVYFRFEAGDHGGIADEGFDNGKRWQSSSERRYTVPLLEILRDRARAPPVIDYLSLDVEGAESFIMQNFPLDQYRIKIITAERLRGDIRGYLKSHGFEFVTRLTRWGESLWVHHSVREELDWTVMERFNFPL